MCACGCGCVGVWVWVCGATNDLLHFRCSVIHSAVNYKYKLVSNPKYARGESERHEVSVELPSPVVLPGVWVPLRSLTTDQNCQLTMITEDYWRLMKITRDY